MLFHKWAIHKTSSATVAEDLVQESFLAAAEKIDSFKGDSSPKTWLFSILNHKIIDHYRKKVNQHVPMENATLSAFFDEDGVWQKEKKPKEWDEEETNLSSSDDVPDWMKDTISEDNQPPIEFQDQVRRPALPV